MRPTALYLLLTLPGLGAAIHAAEPPPADPVSCERPVWRPRVVSFKGHEARNFRLAVESVATHLEVSVDGPTLARHFVACLDKARSVESPDGDAPWAVLDDLRLAVVDDGTVTATVSGRRMEVSPTSSTPAYTAGRVSTWLIGQNASASPRLRNAVWTLWIESYLAAVGGFNAYIYADDLDDSLPREDLIGYGPGIFPLRKTGRLIVASVFDPELEKQGVKWGLELIEWNGTPIAELTMQELLTWWKRPEPFDYSFRVAGREEPFHAHSVPFYPQPLDWGMLGRTAYVRVNYFSVDVLSSYRGIVRQFPIENVEHVILDLRDNGGGYAEHDFVGAFFRPDEIYASFLDLAADKTQNFVGTREYYELPRPIYVLINGRTVSMPELLAAGLLRHGKAMLIGERTFGKGVGQGSYPTSAEGALHLVNTRFYYPRTLISWHGKGIAPHVGISPSDEESEEISRLLGHPIIDLEHQVTVDPVLREAFVQIEKRGIEKSR